MKAGNATSEFYVTVISSLVGLGTFAGIVLSDQAVHLINAGVTIVSALIAIAPAVSYILGRTWLKGKALNQPTTTVLTGGQPTVVTTQPVQPTTQEVAA